MVSFWPLSSLSRVCFEKCLLPILYIALYVFLSSLDGEHKKRRVESSMRVSLELVLNYVVQCGIGGIGIFWNKKNVKLC